MNWKNNGQNVILKGYLKLEMYNRKSEKVYFDYFDYFEKTATQLKDQSFSSDKYPHLSSLLFKYQKSWMCSK